MALKPTIYKFTVSLADLDRNYYADHSLTVAQHPSETVERMMVRVLAWCLNADDQLTFTRGLSTNDEPDLWRHSLDGQVLDWIEVGEPTAERLRKASRLADRVLVYTFNTKSEIWWRQTGSAIEGLSVAVYRFPWDDIEHLAAKTRRTMQMSITISDGCLSVATESELIDVQTSRLDD